MKKFILSLLVLFAINLSSNEDFVSDPLEICGDSICIISSFEEQDYFTTYDQEGTVLWEIPYRAKILSWKLDREHIFILSKNRNGQVYYLSCVNPKNGEIIWGNAIFSPEFASSTFSPSGTSDTPPQED